MQVSATTNARELQDLQATADVDLITFTQTVKPVRNKDGKLVMTRVAPLTHRLNVSRLMGFRSPWSATQQA